MQIMFKYLMLENSCHTILTVNIQSHGRLGQQRADAAGS